MINKDLETLRKWFWCHKLSPNSKKSVILSFGYKDSPNLENQCYLHERDDCRIICSCMPLKLVNSFRYLGVVIDLKLI